MMKRKRSVLCLGLFVLSIFYGGCATQQQTSFKAVEQKTHSALIPVSKSLKWWMPRHQEVINRVKQGNVDLIFIGDSITHHWEDKGSEVWQQFYGGRNAVNMGFRGDRTQHVLWRLDNGEVDGISPKVAVLLIGTNNHPPRNTTEEISDGIIAVCAKLRKKLPETKLLLLAIFPRSPRPCEMRDQLSLANKTVATIADGKMIHYLDIGDKFLEPDKSISKEIMPDYLHLTPKGYKIWALAIEPKLTELLAEKK